MCSLLLYNMMGFSLVYWIEECASYGEKSESNLVKPTASGEFIVIKIPIMIPYQTDWQVAEPAEGRLRRGDDFYQIVEQQLMNDTLYVKCKLDISARDRYLDLVSHVDKHVKNSTTDGKSKAPHLLKSFLKDYLTFNRKHLFFIMDWISARAGFNSISLHLPSFFLHIASPPPR
jgi:hypothetical protein